MNERFDQIVISGTYVVPWCLCFELLEGKLILFIFIDPIDNLRKVHVALFDKLSQYIISSHKLSLFIPDFFSSKFHVKLKGLWQICFTVDSVLCSCFVFDFVCLFVRFLVNFDIFLFQHGNKEEDIVEQSADNVLKVDVVGLMFIIFFLFILFVQFFGMIVHRSDVLFEE